MVDACIVDGVMTHQRTLRLADGPDEVHRASLAKLEFSKHMLLRREVEMPITRGS
jgi:acyl-CoA dehydrogenase